MLFYTFLPLTLSFKDQLIVNYKDVNNIFLVMLYLQHKSSLT